MSQASDTFNGAYDQETHEAAIASVHLKCKEIKGTAEYRLGKAIEWTAEVYEFLYWVDAPSINNGLCEDFANDVVAVMEAVWEIKTEAWWGEDLAGVEFEDFDGPAHCFIVFKDRYYDSERPLGEDHWKQLPCFENYRS